MGKTSGGQYISSTFADHPHVCGENPLNHRIGSGGNGPSPRVWGKPTQTLPLKCAMRTIPTCVGKTGQSISAPHVITDHPHVCGENRSRLWQHRQVCGPSPRVWGKRHPPLFCIIHFRTIPTCVGKTGLARHAIPLWPDHPHVCGENIRRSRVLPSQ